MKILFFRDFWEIDEDIILLSEYLVHSSKWTKISEKLTGRNIYSIKNHFHSLLKKNNIFFKDSLDNEDFLLNNHYYNEKIRKLKDRLLECKKRKKIHVENENQYFNLTNINPNNDDFTTPNCTYLSQIKLIKLINRFPKLFLKQSKPFQSNNHSKLFMK